MRLAERKAVLKNSGIELNPDEKVLALIDANTHRSLGRAANNVYKCLALIAGGTSFRTSSRLTGIPYATISTWRSKEWYTQAIELIRMQLDEQLDGKMTHVLNKSINKLEQRLEQGDPVVDRNGGITYKPVTAKDSAIISSIFFDKRNLLRNKPTSITSNQSTDERLQHLADKFREIAVVNGEYSEVDSADGEYDDITDGDFEEVTEHVEGQLAQTNADNATADGGELGSSFQTEGGETADQNEETTSTAWTFSGA